MADRLSKGKLDKVRLEARLNNKLRVKMSSTLARWFRNATQDLCLGRKCLLEVAGKVEVYAGLDYYSL